MISLVVTAVAALVPIGHLSDTRALAAVASDPTPDLRARGGDLFHSIGRQIVLLIPLWLSVHKPRGPTR